MHQGYFNHEIKFINQYKRISDIKKKNIKFIKKFSAQGKQGVTGLIKILNLNDEFVYKSSQYINFLGRHEYKLMKSLEDLSEFCPHFCKALKMFTCKVHPEFVKQDNIFRKNCKYPIKTDLVIQEYISSNKLYDSIKNHKMSEIELFSIVKQLLLCLSISQREKQFSHYDLHSGNILIRKCHPDDVFLYILDDNNYFCVPTHGYFPVIIDFGFSYCKDLIEQPIYSSLAHTNVGFMTNQFDPIADPKLLLISVSDELRRNYTSKSVNTFRNIVRNIFEPLNIDWECGWDNYNKPGASDYIIKSIKKIKHDSYLFRKFPHYCIDTLQSMITLPLKKKDTSQIEIAYKTLVTEFYKIESQLSKSVHHLYILKEMVKIARKLEKKYLKNVENAVKKFKRHVYSVLSEISSYCRPKNVDFDKLLCSLYVFSNCSEGILYDRIEIKNKSKDFEYSQLELNTPEKIYGAFEVNLKSEYVFNEKSKVYVFDCVNKNRDYIDNISNEWLEVINETHPIMRGSVLYDYYTEKCNQRVNNGGEDDEQEFKVHEEEVNEEEVNEEEVNEEEEFEVHEDEVHEDEVNEEEVNEEEVNEEEEFEVIEDEVIEDEEFEEDDEAQDEVHEDEVIEDEVIEEVIEDEVIEDVIEDEVIEDDEVQDDEVQDEEVRDEEEVQDDEIFSDNVKSLINKNGKLTKNDMKPVCRLGKFELKIFTQRRCNMAIVGKYKKGELLELLSEFDKLGKYNKGNEKYDKLYDVNIKLLEKDYKRISRFSKTELLHFMKVRYDLNISSIKKKDAMNIIREKEDKEER